MYGGICGGFGLNFLVSMFFFVYKWGVLFVILVDVVVIRKMYLVRNVMIRVIVINMVLVIICMRKCIMCF